MDGPDCKSVFLLPALNQGMVKLVSRSVWDREIGSSNLSTLTIGEISRVGLPASVLKTGGCKSRTGSSPVLSADYTGDANALKGCRYKSPLAAKGSNGQCCVTKRSRHEAKQ